MAGTHGIPDVQPSGLSAEDLLFMAQNPDKLAETLNAIKDERGKLNATIALAGPAAEILTLREQAKAATATANQAWNDAQAAKDKATVDADTVRTAARKQATEILNNATSQAEAMTTRAAAARDEAEKAATSASTKLDEANRRHAELDAREMALAAKEAAADGVRRTYEAKLADLKQRLAGV